MADVDNDGQQEFITTNSWNISGTNDTSYIEIFKMNGNNKLYLLAYFKLKGYYYLNTPMVTDINNDGNKEIIVKNINPGWLGVYQYNVSSKKIDSLYTISEGTGTYDNLAVANLNDTIIGNKEIVAVDNSTGTGVIHIYNPSGTNFCNSIAAANGYSFGVNPVLVDINGDNRLEIIDLVGTASGVALNAYQYNGNSYIQCWSVLLPNFDANYFGDAQFSVGDIDNDGILEIVVMGSGYIYVIKNQTVIFTQMSTIPNLFTTIDEGTLEGSFPNILLANIDNDSSDLELLQFYDKYIIAYKYSSSTGYSALVPQFPFQTNGEISGQGQYTMACDNGCASDINGDGKNEILVTEESNIVILNTPGKPQPVEQDLLRYNLGFTGAIEGTPQLSINDENLVYSAVNPQDYIINLYENVNGTSVYNYYNTKNAGTVTTTSLSSLDVTPGIIDMVNVQNISSDDFTSNFSVPKYLYCDTCNEIYNFTSSANLKTRTGGSNVDLQKYVSSNQITAGTITIPTGISVSFSSSVGVLLQNGFNAVNGCNFQAYIGGCSLKSLSVTNNTEKISDINTEKKDIELYPNPTTGRINISIPEAMSNTVNIEILTMSGIALINNEFIKTQLIDIDLSGYNSGLYLVRIVTNENTHIYKVIKQ